jgi:DNA-binding MarR family transcriptional regulator
MTNSPHSALPTALGKADFERLSNFRYRLRHFHRASELLCKRHGVTPLQYQLLLHVMGFPLRDWATVGELADRLQAHHHGVVALLNRCEGLGLIERRSGRTDQRIVEIHLLPKGRRLLDRLATQHASEVQTLVRSLAAEFDAVRPSPPRAND